MTNVNMSKKSMLLVVLILWQLFIVMVITEFNFVPFDKFIVSKEFISLVLFVIAIIITVVTLVIFNEIIEFSKQQFQAKMAEQKLQDSQELIQVLRANQHDFMNHLQVLYSAAQLGKIELVHEYFEGIVKDVREISSISKITLPEIAALIYSKISKAEELTSEVNVEINTTLSNLKMTTVDLSRILGNLFDNAIYAISEVELNDRKLNLKIIESETEYQFIVSNFRPIIPEDILNVVFNAGFTTKGNKGSGLGLYNVKNIVTKYHGEVKVTSDLDTGTVFTVIAPKFN